MVELAGAGNMSANYANEIIEFGTKLAKVSALSHTISFILSFKIYIYIRSNTVEKLFIPSTESRHWIIDWIIKHLFTFDYSTSNVRIIVSGARLIVLKSVQIMATPEERRSADHLLHDVTIDELQQLTDMRMLQVERY